MTSSHIVAHRKGVTMLELIVALSLMGILSGVVSFAWTSGGFRASEEPASTTVATIHNERRLAIASGKTRRVVIRSGHRVDTLFAHPDGRLDGGNRYGFDPLSGRKLKLLSADNR